MERPDSYQWFPNRVNFRQGRRERARWGALFFNGLFLILYFIGTGMPESGLWMPLIGMILAPLGLIGLFSSRFRIREQDQLEASMIERGISNHRLTSLEIYRGGVLLGRDVGWVGRQNGILLFEGQVSRFEVVRDDLVYVPDGSQGEIPGRLTVRSDLGTIDLRFNVVYQITEDERKWLFVGWPSAERTLPGPPSIPKERSFADRLAMTHQAHGWLPIPFIFFGLSFLIPTEGWTLVAIRLVLLVTGIVAGWITFLGGWRKDDADIARLLAEDAERLQAARIVVIETNNAGTGNPAVNAAVG